MQAKLSGQPHCPPHPRRTCRFETRQQCYAPAQSESARSGLEALDYLRTEKSPPGAWKETQLALIQQAETPDESLLKLPWMESYRALILVATEVERLKKVDRKEWKQQVLDEAAKQEPVAKYTW